MTVATKDLSRISVPYGKSVHGEEEIAAVVDVLRTSTQMGPNVERFEERIAGLFDKKYGVMVNSGSSALLLAFEIMDLDPGSEVITPALTFGTTVSSMLKSHLVPAFVDVEEDTFCIDAGKIEALISGKTRAICVPNLIGNIADWQRIHEIAEEYELQVIEDSADTLGGRFENHSSGVYSDISITSFYGSHLINCAGNGGMLCVNSEDHAEKAKLLRSWGRSSSLYKDSERIEDRFNVEIDNIEYDRKFVFEAIGYNLEPSELGAAFGLVQLKHLEDTIASRTKYFRDQYRYFEQYEDWFILPRQTRDTASAWLAFPVIIRDTAPFTRREMQVFLEERGIQTRVVFTGNITRQPGFRNITLKRSTQGYPMADQVMRGGLLLACHHGLNEDMMAHVHQSCDRFLHQFS